MLHKFFRIFIAFVFVLCCNYCFAQGTINGSVTESTLKKVAQPGPCLDSKKLENICLYIDGRVKDPQPLGDYVYVYQRRIFEAAGVDVIKDSEEVIAQKIRFMWESCWNKLTCLSVQFDASGTSIIKFAISSKFDDFIYDVIDWKVNLNRVDEVDKRTVLDYVQYQLQKHSGTSIESKYRHYYKIFREAGAKHKSEL